MDKLEVTFACCSFLVQDGRLSARLEEKSRKHSARFKEELFRQKACEKLERELKFWVESETSGWEMGIGSNFFVTSSQPQLDLISPSHVYRYTKTGSNRPEGSVIWLFGLETEGC